MNKINMHIDLFDLVLSIARAVDLMSPAVGEHHMQVAYLASRIGEALKLPKKSIHELLMAGALHDIGAFSLKNRLELLEFEDSHPGSHATAGYLLLRDLEPLSPVAELIQFHHVPWENGKGAVHRGQSVSMGSHILHLADRISVKISRDRAILSQVEEICERISKDRNTVFVPKHVDAMLDLAGKDYIWLEVTSGFIETILKKNFLPHVRELSIDQLLKFSHLICRLIDFKSAFTATHSSGVAATASKIASFSGFSKHERRFVETAAYLHDLGKLAIPSEILEKKDQLTSEEWFVMRSHVYFTYETLSQFDALREVNFWGALHQERLNGTGYPFGFHEDDLPLGARIMAVADVFTALTEDRPYRMGMDRKDALEILHSMTARGDLDQSLVAVLHRNFDEMDSVRKAAQQATTREYDSFHSLINRKDAE